MEKNKKNFYIFLKKILTNRFLCGTLNLWKVNTILIHFSEFFYIFPKFDFPLHFIFDNFKSYKFFIFFLSLFFLLKASPSGEALSVIYFYRFIIL